MKCEVCGCLKKYHLGSQCQKCARVCGLVGMKVTSEMKQQSIENKTVYVAAPKRLFKSSFYFNAIKYLELHHPKELLLSHRLYTSNRDWLKMYVHTVAICDAMVIVTNDFLVGRGVYLEWEVMKKKKGEIFLVNHRGGYSLTPVVDLMVVDAQNYFDYAEVIY
jgi:hypothetical protein